MVVQTNLISILLFVISLIIGLVIFLFTWGKLNKEQITLDWVSGIFAAVVSVVILTGWLGVVLALFGLFSLMALAVLLLVVSGVVYGWQRPFAGLRFQRLTLIEWLLVALLIGSAVVYFRPHEYIFGAADAGTYMNIGATIAQTGTFVEHDPWQSFLYQYADITLREQIPPEQTRYRQFVGWLMDNENTDRIMPQFLPFHPVLLAVGIGLGGIYGGLLSTPLWSVLSLAAVFLLARQLFNPEVGLLAAVFLALTPLFIFFARYPTTEPLTLLLVFTMLWCFHVMWDKRQAGMWWGLLGGAALGAATLTRLDLPFVVLLAIGFLVLAWLSGHWSRGYTAFTAVFIFFLVQTVLSGIFVNWPYYWNVYGAIYRSLSQSGFVVGGVGVSAVFLFVIIWLIARHGWDSFTQSTVGLLLRSRTLRYVLITAVILLSAYAYFLRPVWEPVTYYQPHLSDPIPRLDGQNWVRLGWYLTPLGLLLATVGLAIILHRYSLLRLGLFLSVGVFTTLQYTYRIFNTPYHIYAMRRYVPIALPTLLIFAAVAIVAIFYARPNRQSKLVGSVLGAALIMGLIFQARYVLPNRDLRGAVAQMEELNEALAADSIILINDPRDSAFADTLGVPLRNMYGHDIATIRETGDNFEAYVVDLMALAQAEQRPLQFIAIDPIDPEVRRHFNLKPVAMIPISLKMLMNTYDSYPSEMQNVYYGVEIYDILPMVEEEKDSIMIDVGLLDAAYLENGFYYKEPIPGDITMRWVSDKAGLEIPALSDTEIQIDIRARIFDPELNPGSHVVVFLDGQQIGEFSPENSWQTYSFVGRVQPESSTSTLAFESTTFNPAEMGLNQDTRDLGFVLDWVRVAVGEQ